MRATAIAMGLLAAMLLQLGPLGVDAAGAEYAHLDPPFADATTARASRDLGALSDYFTENAGQVGNPEVLYYARGGGVSVGFAAGAVLVNLRDRPARDDLDPRTGPMVHASAMPEAPTAPSRGHLVRIAFEGADPVLPQPRGELPHHANFFLGDDPARWRTNVRNYAEVVYEDAWDGIDVVYHTSPGGVKYDLVVHPGADLADVAFAYEGITDLAVTPRGLSAETSLGPLRDDVPAAWQASGRPVDCVLRQTGERTVGYACPGWDGTGNLVIDPLLYATYLGGWDACQDYYGYDCDYASSIALDAAGNAHITGWTVSTDFPVTPGAFDETLGGLGDAFVAKLSPSGSRLYSTYLGGDVSDDWGNSIAIDTADNAYVIGTTNSLDFPVTPGAFDATLNGADAFVAKLDPTGSALLYSTFLGGTDDCQVDRLCGDGGGFSIAIDAAGSAHVTGVTDSADFPVTPGAFDTSYNGGYFGDAFVAKLDPVGGSLLYSTYVGGGGDEAGHSIALDATGDAYVTGWTNSTDFPVTLGAFDTTLNGVGDAFVAKLDAGGASLLFSTYLGGAYEDYAISIAIDAAGDPYVTGWTSSADFPVTPGAFDATLDGQYDSFVTKLATGGAFLLYSTYLGGVEWDGGSSIAIDADGNAHVTGWTCSADFPVTPGAFDTSYNGGCPDYLIFDAFVVKLDPGGASLLYSTYLGGTYDDAGASIAIDAAGIAHVTGWTNSTDFPVTPGAFDTSYNGGYDAFVVKLSLVPVSMPVLSATGEPNYVVDGLDPEAGTLATLYAYRVNYTDADGNPPAAGDPKVHIRKGGVEIAGSPFPMTAVNPADTTYTDGKWYAYATPLVTRGTDYTYYFTATDATGLAAADWPSPANDAPNVLNAAPTADAGLDQVGVFRGAIVTLDGTASSDPDGDQLTYFWTQTAGLALTLTNPNTANPTFTPATAGTYAFILAVDDGDPDNGTDADTVIVTVWGLVPVANLTADRMRANVGGAFLFSGAGSTDADGTIAAYLFEFADGAGQLGGSDTATHAYAAPGSYVVRLTVWDDDGNASVADVLTVTVNVPPVASGTVTPASGTLATTFTFTSTSTDSDGTIVTTSWDLGDGATDSGTTVTHAYVTRQTFTITLIVWDDDGATATSTLSVSVGNRPPTAVLAVTPDAGDVGTVFTFDGSASTDDGTIVAFAWDFGDGTAGSGVVVTHRYARNGTFAVTLTVTDDGGLEGTATEAVVVSPVPESDDRMIIGIITIIIGVIILVLWRLRFVWFPYFILWCYTKLRRDEVLDNFTRGEIYGFIRSSPGESYSDIKRNLGLPTGELTYHLAVLERMGLVRSVPDRARKLFYPADVPVPRNGGDLRAWQIRIVGILKGDPGIDVSDLAGLLGVSRQVALYHLRKLASADHVRLERRFARLRAYPGRATRTLER
ncbi:MAG TPA: PKD domain-containing protein [Thermoplasmata archaeon]|nr:PKD domain-containing protein [Thermoplasmata archaeon]